MFSDFRMQSEVARKINFLNGFVQPGSVTGTGANYGAGAGATGHGILGEPMACWKSFC